MARVLFAVTGSRHWTLKDGTQHPCGYWPEELAVPHEVFAAAGLQITVATPGAVSPVPDEAGFTPEMNGGSEEPGRRFRAYLDRISDQLTNPVDLDEVTADDFDLVFVPGGHGPMEDLAGSASFGRLLAEFTAQNKAVAAVCHGPAALLPAQDEYGWLFRGRRVTGSPTWRRLRWGSPIGHRGSWRTGCRRSVARSRPVRPRGHRTSWSTAISTPARTQRRRCRWRSSC